MDVIDKTVLKILSNANGHVAVTDLMREFKRRVGVDGSRTRGILRTLEQSLLRLQKSKLISASKQILPSKRHSHCSTVGRDVKPSKRTGCCTPSPEEKLASAQVKEYRCAFYALTEAGKLTLPTTRG